jgi:hypothetical protein
MHPDFSQSIPVVRTGLRVTLMPLRLPDTAHGNGKDWDVFTVIGMEDENGCPTAHAVSLAVKATKRQIRDLLKKAQGKQVLVEGVMGPEERDSTGQDVFRRVFCKAQDIKILGADWS